MDLLSPVVSRRGFIVLGTVTLAVAHSVAAPAHEATAEVASGAPIRPHVTLLGVL